MIGNSAILAAMKANLSADASGAIRVALELTLEEEIREGRASALRLVTAVALQVTALRSDRRYVDMVPMKKAA